MAVALTLVSAAAVGCGPPDSPESAPLLVMGASDLQAAFRELVPLYEERTGDEVDLVLGSTGNLAAQIRNGAPADVFFSANEAFLDGLMDAGLMDPTSRAVYAVGRLVLVAPPGREPPTDLHQLSSRPDSLVALANPEHAPYGMAAREALQTVGLWEDLRGVNGSSGRLVLGENVVQTHQLVTTGNADVGVVALGLVVGLPGPPTPYTLVDNAVHAPLRQAAGVVRDSPRRERAQAFLDFVLSEEGQALLQRYGFESPEASQPLRASPPRGGHSPPAEPGVR
ncbi:MAG: molybdate ABC transporter substrate-binding protein [Gemmatimonadota bacterium]